MRILLVTLQDILPFAITQVLNPANEYCAIVTDEVEPAKNFVKSVGGSENLIHPFYELKECIENFYYDVVICVSDGRTTWTIGDRFNKYNLSREKFIFIHLSNDMHNQFLLDRAIKYYEQEFQNFDAFATGMSYAEVGIDSNRFKHKIFNFARGGQDLYFDYQLAKFAITRGGGVGIFANRTCSIQFSLR